MYAHALVWSGARAAQLLRLCIVASSPLLSFLGYMPPCPHAPHFPMRVLSDNLRTSRLVALAAARALPWSCRRPARRLDDLDFALLGSLRRSLLKTYKHSRPHQSALNLFCSTLHGRLQSCQRPRSITSTPLPQHAGLTPHRRSLQTQIDIHREPSQI